MKLSLESKNFLTKLSTELEKVHSHPVLLRNYDELPDEIGNDIDLFVKREKLTEAEDILLECVALHQGYIAHMHRRDYFVAYWMKFGNEDKFWHIDLYPGALSWHGYQYLDTGRFLGMTRKIGDWNVPRKAHEALITFLTSVLWGGFYKSKYNQHLNDLLSDPDERTEFLSCLGLMFSEESVNQVLDTLKNEPTASSTQSLASNMRFSLRIKCLIQSPIASSIFVVRHWLGEMVCYLFKPPGISIEVPHKGLPDDLQQVQMVYSVTGNFFGGVLDLRKKPNGIRGAIIKKMQELRARGKNFVVLRNGSEWKISGDKTPPQKIPSKFMDRVSDFLTQRVPFKN